MTAFYVPALRSFQGKPRFDEHAAAAQPRSRPRTTLHAHAAMAHRRSRPRPRSWRPGEGIMMDRPLPLSVLAGAVGDRRLGRHRRRSSRANPWMRPVGSSPCSAPVRTVHHLRRPPSSASWASRSRSPRSASSWRSAPPHQQPSIATAMHERRFGGVHRTLYTTVLGGQVLRRDRRRTRSTWRPCASGASGTRRSWTASSTVSATSSKVFPALLRLFQTGYVGTYALFIALGVLVPCSFTS